MWTSASAVSATKPSDPLTVNVRKGMKQSMFGLSRRKKRQPIDRRRSLESIPAVNEGVTAHENDGGELVLVVSLERGTGLLARFQPPVMEKRVKLDELGAFVFQQIDGKRTTREIIDAFASHYRVNHREAELSCVQFLKSLVTRRVISILVP